MGFRRTVSLSRPFPCVVERVLSDLVAPDPEAHVWLYSRPLDLQQGSVGFRELDPCELAERLILVARTVLYLFHTILPKSRSYLQIQPSTANTF